jgi:BetI-type transcriptional repressor, C-terminal
LWVELWSRALRNGEAARKREALDRRWRNTIAEVVREGQRSGEFGPCDPERFATYLSALMDGLALQMLLKDSAVDGEMMNKMCLDAATRELSLDPTALRRGNGGEREELATEG